MSNMFIILALSQEQKKTDEVVTKEYSVVEVK